MIKSGNVFYNKSFGHHTYDKKRKVEWNTVYDIASITKIAATTYSLMKLTDDTLIDINKDGFLDIGVACTDASNVLYISQNLH